MITPFRPPSFTTGSTDNKRVMNYRCQILIKAVLYRESQQQEFCLLLNNWQKRTVEPVLSGITLSGHPIELSVFKVPKMLPPLISLIFTSFRGSPILSGFGMNKTHRFQQDDFRKIFYWSKTKIDTIWIQFATTSRSYLGRYNIRLTRWSWD